MADEHRLRRPSAVRLGLTARDHAEAVEQCGRLLVEVGAVAEPYVAAMHERESSMSTHIGEGVAIPHGTTGSRRHVHRPALVVLQYPGGVRWSDGALVRLCVGIAAGPGGSGDPSGGDSRGDGNSAHLDLLAVLAKVLMDPERARLLREAPDEATVELLLRATDHGAVDPGGATGAPGATRGAGSGAAAAAAAEGETAATAALPGEPAAREPGPGESSTASTEEDR